jgi:FADH2 O2-dependent halogenase
MPNVDKGAARIFDVAILGTGVGGTILGAILARNGLRVLLLEQGTHPRFAIGESTIPETTFLFRVLAARYDVPELANLATFTRLRKHVGPSHGVKRNFSFAYHRPGEEHRPDEVTQLPTFSPPLGPDMHFFRQDLDAYLLSVATLHGATLRQRTDVTDVSFAQELVQLRTSAGDSYQARYVVDAGGIKSLLGQTLAQRHDPCPMATRTRTIYAHMVGVTPFDACYRTPRAHGMPSPLSQGTLHHLFDGGWMWVIPFDNHATATNRACSVGLTLDLDRHPRSDKSPEQEFWDFIEAYPSIAQQFAGATALRDWVGTDRLQFSSARAVGDRWCLLPHAFSFVDPLFSSGLSITMSIINQLAHRLLRAAAEDDFSTQRFQYIDTWSRRSFEFYDRVVSSSYTAFSDFDLWNAWQRVWTVGGLYGASMVLELLFRQMRSRDRATWDAFEEQPYRGVLAADLPECVALVDVAEKEIVAYRKGAQSSKAAAARIFDHVRASGMWPAPWGGPSPELRHPGGLTLDRVFAFGRWLQEASPPAIRRHFYSVDPKLLLREAAVECAGQVKDAVGTFTRWSHDVVTPWNREWVRPVSTTGGPPPSLRPRTPRDS